MQNQYLYKVCCGIPVMPRQEKLPTTKTGYLFDYEIQDISKDPWCDFEVDYYPKENVYALCFETYLGFDSKEDCRDWIVRCLDCFTEYMKFHNYDTTKELDIYEVFADGMNARTRFATIEDAYATMKLLVNGFHGNGLYIVEE